MFRGVAKFKQYVDWVKVWSGRWSLHSDTHFGYHWTVQDKVAQRPAFERVIYLYSRGITDCWVSKHDKDDLGARLIRYVNKSPNNARKMATSLRRETESLMSFVKFYSKKDISLSLYQRFWHLAGKYYLPHLSVKYLVDYLSDKQLKRLLPVLEEARLYSENVFYVIEDFMVQMAEQVAKQCGYDTDLVLATSKHEMCKYFVKAQLPTKDELRHRSKSSAMLYELGSFKIFTGSDARTILHIVEPTVNKSVLSGQTGYAGKVHGLVRIVQKPSLIKVFNRGDILVAGMTRPDFVPLMKKAGAIVTDAGGILSHAAIVARELKKPCVIDTKVASKILKNGDRVEVDANNGVVRKL